MKKVIALILGIIFLTMGGLIFAQSTPLAAQAVRPLEVSNKHCPVSSSEVGVMAPAVKITYKGKVYSLCCPGCMSTFNSNPEKYSKIAQDDAKIKK